MRTRRFDLYFALALAILGFALGAALRLAAGGGASRTIASIDARDSVNAYDRLVCPAEAEYRAAAERVHLEVPAGLRICEDPNHGRLAKLFHLAASLDVRFPPDFPPSLQADLGDTLGFLARMTSRLAFDFTQETTVAFNKVREHSIFLGGIFFHDSPLEALDTLMHEARHSSANDPGHVTCQLGDIPTANGGCDRQFSLEESSAGAYSYGAAYAAALGLYARGVSSGDREFLLSDSLATISTRFNHLPPALAAAHDLVALLGENGEVSLLYPFFGGTVPLPVPGLREGEKVERLEFNVRNNGIYLFTSARRILTWAPASGFSRPFPALLAEDAQVLDAGRIPVPYENYPYTSFLFAGNELRYVQYNSRAGHQELEPYPMRGRYRATGEPPELLRFFNGLGGRGLFLGRDGRFYAGAQFGGDPAFNPRADLNPSSWAHGSGGVLTDSVFGVGADGKLRRVVADFADPPDTGGEAEERFSWEEDRFQAPGATKFQEGLYLRALLTGTGELHFESFASARRWVAPGKLRDFAIFRGHTAELLPPAAAANTCRLRDLVREPWLGWELGLDEAGYVVGRDCRRLSSESYASLRLLPATEPLAADPRSAGEPARLQAGTGAGRTEILRPYESR